MKIIGIGKNYVNDTNEIIVYVSSFMTLEPSDLIFTGIQPLELV